VADVLVVDDDRTVREVAGLDVERHHAAG